ncbi:MAG: hypothetical protein ACRDLB_11840, partial [Actinomycetota bacterium]
VRLTERDLTSLHWTGEQYSIRLDQLARLLGRADDRTLTESTTRAAVTRWTRAGLAESRKVTVREPGFVWLTSRGLREVGLSFKGWEPTASTAWHIYWTNQVRLYIENRHPEFSWRSERHMRAGRPMQTISDDATHLADGELIAADSVVGIEVELTSKSAPRREAIMRMLADSYPTVWYFAPPTVVGCLERTAANIDASKRERVRIYPLERVA